MSDGTESKTTAERVLHLKSWQGEIRKIIVWYNAADAMLFGFEFFNSQGISLVKTGYDTYAKPSKEYVLEEGERIIGFRAAGYSNTHAAYLNFQFIIG